MRILTLAILEGEQCAQCCGVLDWYRSLVALFTQMAQPVCRSRALCNLLRFIVVEEQNGNSRYTMTCGPLSSIWNSRANSITSIPHLSKTTLISHYLRHARAIILLSVSRRDTKFSSLTHRSRAIACRRNTCRVQWRGSKLFPGSRGEREG
jgi:hypothetical protein